ncbi:MAG: helix-turn-helix domain-containing protein [Candidatus Acidiferrales bacterium]
MATAVHANCNDDQTESSIDRSSQNAMLELPKSQVLLTCILLMPQDAAPILALLQKATPTPASPGQPITTTVRSIAANEPEQNPWLEHSEAAEYLGVARSTLYRYACQERIEARKLGGRLEYRRSTLDKFKEQQIRPARRSRTRGIITPTLGSGK